MNITELEQIYQSALDQCISNISLIPDPQHGGPALPLTIQPPQGYQDSRMKVMYFGQETNGWSDPLNKDLPFHKDLKMQDLLRIYDEFANNKNGVRHSGQFWTAVNHFQRDFSQIEPDCRFLYNNLIKMGKLWDKGKPPASVMEWQSGWFDLICDEIRILNPDVIIFFSGPNYDYLIRRILGQVSFEEVAGYKTRKLARVVSPKLPYQSFRTYHPNYLWRVNLQAVLDTITSSIRDRKP